jgi:hypothetical protein
MKHKWYTIVKVAARAALIICLFSGNAESQDNGNMHEYSLRVNYPLIKEDGEVINLRDTLPIVFYKDFVCYFLPYQYGEIKEHEFQFKGKRYRYFVFKKGAGFGYLYNDLNDSLPVNKFAVDSFLSKRAFLSNFDSDSLKPAGKEGDSKSILLEKYTLWTKTNEFQMDSVYFYYAQDLKDIPYSFSPKMDKSRSMKLFKVRLMFNGYRSPSTGFDIPKREFSFEITQSPLKHEREVNKLLILFREAGT